MYAAAMLKTDAELDRLVALGRDLQVTISDHELAQVADLVLRLHQDQTRRAGAILPAPMLRTYREREASEREGMRAACKHVLLSLVLLDVIELPAGCGVETAV